MLGVPDPFEVKSGIYSKTYTEGSFYLLPLRDCPHALRKTPRNQINSDPVCGLFGDAECEPLVVILRRLRPSESGALLHQRLELVEMRGIDLARRTAILHADRRRHADDLPHHAGRAHDADRAERRVRDGDVAPRHEEVAHVAGVERAVGNRT